MNNDEEDNFTALNLTVLLMRTVEFYKALNIFSSSFLTASCATTWTYYRMYIMEDIDRER